MQNERGFIDAIINGDDIKLRSLLRDATDATDGDQTLDPITDPRPSNHAIGFGNNRFWNGQPYDEVIAALTNL